MSVVTETFADWFGGLSEMEKTSVLTYIVDVHLGPDPRLQLSEDERVPSLLREAPRGDRICPRCHKPY